VVLIITIAAGSCSNKLYVADANVESKYIPYIKDNQVNLDEVVLKLGQPSWTFENGRIFTYRLYLSNKGEMWPIAAEKSVAGNVVSINDRYSNRLYSLVLIFNSDRILIKHSLIRINP
jgi:hypothetical protein